jgi:hypothetical protein
VSDTDWLDRIHNEPNDRSLRLAYADAIGGERADLIRIEEQMRGIAPTTDEWWQLRLKRNTLRDAIPIHWRGALGYGTEPAASLLQDAWPDDVTDRWRTLRAHIEEVHGVRTGDIGRTCERLTAIEREHGTCGTSLREWIVLLDELAVDGWRHLFRDSLSFKVVEGTKRFSLMIQGEADYHWTVGLADMRKPDPAVKGYGLDYDTDRWKSDPHGTGPYGTFKRITDFVRTMLQTYAPRLAPHPRFCYELTPPTMTVTLPPSVTSLTAKVNYRRLGALDIEAVLKLVGDPETKGSVEIVATRRYERPCSLSMGFQDDGTVLICHVTRTSLVARNPATPEKIYVSRDEAIEVVRFFAVDGDCDPTLVWKRI